MRTIRKHELSLVIMAALLFAAAPAYSQSLWANGTNLFADQKASRVGDIVTVNVVETVDESDEGKSKSDKTTAENIDTGHGLLDFLEGMGFGSVSGYKGNTKIERTKDLRTTISCLVVDVLPNGNMVIQGDRSLKSQGENLQLRFAGVIRPQDLMHNNVVRSDRVANAEIVVTGRGTISRTQRPGIINQILQTIF